MISTEEFCNIIKEYKVEIQNVFEIGSLHGHDANIIKNNLGVKSNNIYIFEAHPIHAKKIKQSYPEFVVINKAIYNNNILLDFNAVTSNNGNLGMSSIKNKSNIMKELDLKNGHRSNEEYDKIKIEGIRMEDWIIENNIKNIDVCKIDVEGCSYECLEGFGSKLSIIKFLHIENEHIECWENQKLYDNVKELLEKNNFKLLKINICGPLWLPNQQSDSVWVNNNIL
jgi:FkbM family methyltransferase